jgi:hypothetical protein
MTTIPKKRGRRTKEEYYQSKKIDNVVIEQDVSIFLPISLEECFHNPNIDMTIEIMSGTPTLLGYSPEKSILDYSELSINLKEYITPVSETPVYIEDLQQDSISITKEYYDITLIKENDSFHKKSSIACWWCCHNFDTPPIHLPVCLKKNIYKVLGIFCSYSCCFSYMKNDSKYSQNMHLLNYLFRNQTGKKEVLSRSIVPAPPREALKLFGGPLTIKEFRENSSIYSLNNYPMIYLPSQLEKTTKNKTEQKYFKILPSKNIKKTVDLPNNSLSKILGISL